MRSLVTPGAVAPPLSAPSFQGFTHTGPLPTMVEGSRPYTPYRVASSCAHFGLSSAAAVPMPVPATGLAAPGGGCTAPATFTRAIVVTIAATSATTRPTFLERPCMGAPRLTG